VELSLPRAALLDEALLARAWIAELRAPGAGELGPDPAAEIVP
jgi:hypothetical protein